jgi:hypothetical protein
MWHKNYVYVGKWCMMMCVQILSNHINMGVALKITYPGQERLSALDWTFPGSHGCCLLYCQWYFGKIDDLWWYPSPSRFPVYKSCPPIPVPKQELSDVTFLHFLSNTELSQKKNIRNYSIHIRNWVLLWEAWIKKKRSSNPTTDLDGPWGFQEVETPSFQDIRHMKVVRVSALHTGCLYLQGTYLVLISVRCWVNLSAIVQPEGLCQWKTPMTPLGIKPAIFRLVAHCPDQVHHPVPPWIKKSHYFRCSQDDDDDDDDDNNNNNTLLNW